MNMVKLACKQVGRQGMADHVPMSPRRGASKVQSGRAEAATGAHQGRQKKAPKDLWFAALMLPDDVSARVRGIINDISERFNTGVSTAPPHVTLVAPFRMEDSNLPVLQSALAAFTGSCAPVQMSLDGFSCFEPRVLFVDVQRGGVMDVKERLDAALQQDCAFVPVERRDFNPHVSVASKRVTPDRFAEAWSYLQDQEFVGSWLGEEVTLLKFDATARAWESHSTYSFQGQQRES